MKPFLAVCILSIVVTCTRGQQLTKEQSEKLKEHAKICIQSSKVDLEHVTKARNGEFIEGPELYNFFDCIFKRVGFLNEQGQLQPDVIRAKVPTSVSKDDVEKVISTCSKAQNESSEKVGFAAYKCYMGETPVKIQLVEV